MDLLVENLTMVELVVVELVAVELVAVELVAVELVVVELVVVNLVAVELVVEELVAVELVVVELVAGMALASEGLEEEEDLAPEVAEDEAEAVVKALAAVKVLVCADWEVVGLTRMLLYSVKVQSTKAVKVQVVMD